MDLMEEMRNDGTETPEEIKNHPSECKEKDTASPHACEPRWVGDGWLCSACGEYWEKPEVVSAESKCSYTDCCTHNGASFYMHGKVKPEALNGYRGVVKIREEDAEWCEFECEFVTSWTDSIEELQRNQKEFLQAYKLWRFLGDNRDLVREFYISNDID